MRDNAGLGGCKLLMELMSLWGEAVNLEQERKMLPTRPYHKFKGKRPHQINHATSQRPQRFNVDVATVAALREILFGGYFKKNDF